MKDLYEKKEKEIHSNEAEKICKITNGQFSWILEVDGQEILFQGFDNADYFEEHYALLSYKVQRSQDRN